MARRLVLYAHGTKDEIDRQQDACRARAEEAGVELAGLATDEPGSRTGWAAANAMVDEGTADGILVASRAVIPDVVESVTGVVRGGRRPRRINTLD